MTSSAKATIEIVNELGLHARAATMLVQLASTFHSDLFIGKDGTEMAEQLPTEKLESRYYIRVSVIDKPGVFAQRQGHVVAHREPVDQRAGLEEVAEPAAQLLQPAGPEPGHVLTVDPHLAVVRPHEAHHVLQADRLSGAAPAHDGEDLAGAHLEIQSVQDLAAAQRLVEVDQSNHAQNNQLRK